MLNKVVLRCHNNNMNEKSEIKLLGVHGDICALSAFTYALMNYDVMVSIVPIRDL